jgi:acetyl esterase/lipase
MKCSRVGALLLVWLLAPGLARAAEPPLTLDLWPGPVPGEAKPIGDEKLLDQRPGEKPVKRLTNVSRPAITVFHPARDKDTGAAVLIAPGGAYNILAWDLEGEEVAAWLNSIGVTGVVLKYRVPRRPDQPKDKPPVGALQDAQRAISLVRSKAGKWGIDPQRIGMLGFSAGGHLTAWTSTNSDQRAYEAGDEMDRVSCRPDFVVLIYPAYLVTKDNQLAPELRVSAETPRTFLAMTEDDPVRVECGLFYYLALKQAKVPAEMHLYPKGGHGYGLRPSSDPVATWPKRAEEWMRSIGVLERK